MWLLAVLGCSQAVPLVPLTEENEEAMENEQFQQLLRKLGIRPPASVQASRKLDTVSAKAHWSVSMRLLSSSCPPHCV